MPKNKECTCPLCSQRFTPENGKSTEEHIALGILKAYREMQDASLSYELPCPRCGRLRMRSDLAKNALSRYSDIYICPECGEDEVARDYARNDRIPVTAWFVAREILSSISGVKCPEFVSEKDNPYPLCYNPACSESAVCNRSLHMDESAYDEHDK